uniref:Uncharacterized protein n=1 Tax=Anguilla anguilla TaxID=7936 RepID=A0A0E9T2K9_ANGAN
MRYMIEQSLSFETYCGEWLARESAVCSVFNFCHFCGGLVKN